MDQVENQTAPSPQNLPERPSFWYLLKNPPIYHKPLVTLVAVTFFLSALGSIVYFSTIGKGQLSFSPPPPNVTQQPVAPTSTWPTLTPSPSTESSPSAIANWKTYKNEKYGFEFKYPQHLSIEKTEPVTNKFDRSDPTVITDFELQISQNNADSLFISVTSEETVKKGGGDFPIYSAEYWFAEKKFIADGSIGSDCSFLLASKFDDRPNECKITKINGFKMLDRIMFWPPGAATGRSFSFYDSNSRYDFIIFSDELYDGGESRLLTIKKSNNLAETSFVNLGFQILSTFRFAD